MQLWPENTIYYEISQGFTQNETELIKRTVDKLGSLLSHCIKFKETSSGNRVSIKHNIEGCNAQRGYQNNVQNMSLNAKRSEGLGTNLKNPNFPAEH